VQLALTAQFLKGKDRIVFWLFAAALELLGLKIGERVETLIRLGLTMNQARAYLALVDLDSASAREIAKSAQITRQDIYRVIPSLQETGIIEKTLGNPAVYIALPMQQGISILLKRKILEQKDLQKKTTELLLDFKSRSGEKTSESFDFLMVTGKDAIIQKIKDNLQRVRSSVDVVISKPRFVSLIPELAEHFRRALNREVKFRFVTKQQEHSPTIWEILNLLLKYPGFEIRYIGEEPETVVSILDGKQAFVTLSSTALFKETLALLSSNSCFVALAQSYFELKWNMAQQKNMLDQYYDIPVKDQNMRL
jgi:sugar-specific transcriptional regulator TrmB